MLKRRLSLNSIHVTNAVPNARCAGTKTVNCVVFRHHSGHNAATRFVTRVNSVRWAGNSSWSSPMLCKISRMHAAQTGSMERHA